MNAIHEQDSIESESDGDIINEVQTVHSVESRREKLIYAKMSIPGKPVRFQVDCGAAVNLITSKYVGKAKMKPPTNTLEMWDKNLKFPVGEAVPKW